MGLHNVDKIPKETYDIGLGAGSLHVAVGIIHKGIDTVVVMVSCFFRDKKIYSRRERTKAYASRSLSRRKRHLFY